MEPTGIVSADDNTRDIQDITDEPCVHDAVEELLALLMDDACEETGRYAFLHCDGVNWKLIGWFPLGFTPPPKPEEDATDYKTLPTPINSPGGKNDLEVAMVLNDPLSEEHESEQNTARK